MWKNVDSFPLHLRKTGIIYLTKKENYGNCTNLERLFCHLGHEGCDSFQNQSPGSEW